MAPPTEGSAGLMPNLMKAKSLINNRGRTSEGAVPARIRSPATGLRHAAGYSGMQCEKRSVKDANMM